MDHSDLAQLDMSRVSEHQHPSSSPRSHPHAPVESSGLEAALSPDQRLPRLTSESPSSPLLGKRKALDPPVHHDAGMPGSSSGDSSASFGLGSSASPFHGAPLATCPERGPSARSMVLFPKTPVAANRPHDDEEMVDVARVLPPAPNSAPPEVASFDPSHDHLGRSASPTVERYAAFAAVGSSSNADGPTSRVQDPRAGRLHRRAAAKRRARRKSEDSLDQPSSGADRQGCLSAVVEEGPDRKRPRYVEVDSSLSDDGGRVPDGPTPISVRPGHARGASLDGVSRASPGSARLASLRPRRSKSLPPSRNVGIYSFSRAYAPFSSPSKARKVRSTHSSNAAVAAIKGFSRGGKGLARPGSGFPDSGSRREGVWFTARTGSANPPSAGLGEGCESPYRTVSIPVEVPASLAAAATTSDLDPIPSFTTLHPLVRPSHTVQPPRLATMYVPPSAPSTSTSPPPSVASLTSALPPSTAPSSPPSSSQARSLPPSTASLPSPPVPVLPRRSVRPASLSNGAPPHVQVMTRHAVDLPREDFVMSQDRSSAGASQCHGPLAISPVIHVPAWAPPITQASMNELELTEVLKNAQLRHDVVFDDGLRFRPNLDGDRGEKKRMLADRYWLAVEREISGHCRCTAWVHSHRHQINYDAPAHVGLLHCICEARLGADPSSPPTAALLPLNRLPSRVINLIRELRNILLSLLPPSPPNGSAIAGIQILQRTPTRTHDLISSMLNHHVIGEAIAEGRMDCERLASFLGFILKSHCAPMRDWLVDRMIGLVSLKEPSCVVLADPPQAINLEGMNGRTYHGLAGGLRLCFEVVELMKLDIANHQLRTLRPLLLETAVDFEIKQFREGMAKSGKDLGKTKHWFAKACSRSDVHIPSEEASTEPIFEALSDGILELLFAVEAAPRSTGRQTSEPSPSSTIVPETFHMDLVRLQNFHCDLADVTVAYMLLTLFQTLAGFSNLREGDVAAMKSELWVFLSDPALRSKGLDSKARSGPGLKKLDCPLWREAMRDVVLHVAARAQAVKQRGRTGEHLPDLRPPSEAVMRVVTSWLDNHLRSNSHLFAVSQKRLRQSLSAIIAHQVQSAPAPEAVPLTMRTGRTISGGSAPPARSRKPAEAAWIFQLPSSRKRSAGDRAKDEGLEKRVRMSAKESAAAVEAILARNGLADLSSELHNVATRIGKMLTFHLRAFGGVYYRLACEESDVHSM